MNYKETVDRIFLENQQNFELPYIAAPLVKLQSLADTICDYVEWVSPVYLKLVEDPETCGIFDVEDAMMHKFTKNRLPQAIICMDVEPAELDEEIVYGQSIIYFFDKRFLTVGTLLHELAHLHSHFDNHGVRFNAAHAELVDRWNLIFKHYNIIDLKY